MIGAKTGEVIKLPGWFQSVLVKRDCGTVEKDLETDWTFPTWALVVKDGAWRAGAARGKAAGAARYEACERPMRQATTRATCWYILSLFCFSGRLLEL